jgi:hypothetical protein
MVMLPQLEALGLRENQKKCEVRVYQHHWGTGHLLVPVT